MATCDMVNGVIRLTVRPTSCEIALLSSLRTWIFWNDNSDAEFDDTEVPTTQGALPDVTSITGLRG